MDFIRKRPFYESSADECRERGFKVGDRLVGNEGYGPTVIEITAIGKESILAIMISQNGKPEKNDSESIWNLGYRDWDRCNIALNVRD
jgi:hypothetical protein